MENGYTRKEISNKLNIGSETLRYYENIGIIPIPVRTKSGYRIYNEEDLLRLKFIKRSKELGFSLSEIADVFKVLNSDKNIDNKIWNNLISPKIEEIDKKIIELTRLREILDYARKDKTLGECDLFKFFIKPLDPVL